MPNRNLMLVTMFVLVTSWSLVAQYSWATPGQKIGNVSQTFAVENMTCAACPITVRKAISRVSGVKNIVVNFDAKTVTVAYDPALADTAEIAEASKSVGFPANPVDKP